MVLRVLPGMLHPTVHHVLVIIAWFVLHPGPLRQRLQPPLAVHTAVPIAPGQTPRRGAVALTGIAVGGGRCSGGQPLWSGVGDPRPQRRDLIPCLRELLHRGLEGESFRSGKLSTARLPRRRNGSAAFGGPHMQLGNLLSRRLQLPGR